MAINLWKLGGKPTSYNPLPFGYQNIPINTGDYIFKCKAKSSLGGTFEITESGTDEFMQYFVLNSEFQDIVFSFSKKKSGEVFLIRDRFTTGDVIVEDIQLVRKPLPKLTINGIDGFNSGKWTLHANAKVIDDETLELNATAQWQATDIALSVIPNQLITFSVDVDSANAFIEFREGGTGKVTKTSSKAERMVLSYIPTTSNIVIRVSNNSSNLGIFTFKKPMLNLGTTPAPHEPKRGDRMVLPSVKNNLFDKQVESGYYDIATGAPTGSSAHKRTINFIPVVSGILYYILKNTANNFFVHYYDVNKNRIGSKQYTGKLYTELTDIPSNATYIRFHFDDNGSVGVDYSKYVVSDGSVQLNKKPKRYVPKKNLFNKDTITPNLFVNSTDGLTYASGVGNSASDWIEVRPNTSYVLSGVPNETSSTGIADHAFYSSNKQFISGGSTFPIVTPSTAKYMRVTIRNLDFNTAQLEEGTTATLYEPYQQVLPRAKSGLVLNGQTDYLQFPSMRMDSVEIDCLIDAVGQPVGSGYLVDMRTGSTNGYVIAKPSLSLGSDVQSVEGFKTGERTKVKIISKSPFTDNPVIFARYTDVGNNQDKLKGTLYKVTFYLGNQVVATYDFEKENDLVKPFVLGKPKWGKKKAKRTLESKR